MKSIRRGLAVLLAVLLLLPNLPASAEEAVSLGVKTADEVSFNTGNRVWTVVNAKTYLKENVSCNESVSGNDTVSGNEEISYQGTVLTGDACFEEDGSYTINIPEENPFFPYEVQFTCNGEVTNQWFMTPDDSVEVGGHTFYVSAYFDNTQVTQMSFNVAGKKVIVYPEEKSFTNGEEMMPFSLQPLEEKWLNVDLSAFTPLELTMVSVDSLFMGETVLKDTDKVMWTYTYEDDYTVNTSGDILDLSYKTYQYSSINLEMIVGAYDQLAADNIRYIIRAQITQSEDWLIPTVYTQDGQGNRTNISKMISRYSDYTTDDCRRLRITIPKNATYDIQSIYLGLSINPDVFESMLADHVKVYFGDSKTAEEAMKMRDITDEIWNVDMSQSGAGYGMAWEINTVESMYWMTLVAFDSDNRVIGCLPILIDIYSIQSYISWGVYGKNGNSRVSVWDSSTYNYDNGYPDITITLYKEYPANALYNIYMNYYEMGISNNSAVTAAYIGQYSSIAEAKTAGAEDIKDALLDQDYYTGGYAADYSQGVYFTIFVGEDGAKNQEIYHYRFQTTTGENSSNWTYSGTNVWFNGLKDSTGKEIPAYVVDEKADSYAEYNYLTILVGPDVNISSLAPVFSLSSKAKLYAAGSRTEEQSGISLHDFSKGAVQYTVSAEDGVNAKNYWLQVVKATEGAGRLYINSLADAEAETRIENGVIYSTREVMLDGYHEDEHDILMANMGTDAISALSVELISDVVELDDYWTLKGKYELSGFTTTQNNTSYGELPNLAKVRIRAKDNTAAGTEISGTLTVKSGETVLMVLNLTGTVGDPCIITDQIPEAVKYVPYGTMIQNNNKYSWNKVNYTYISGSLPEGMTVKPNGEIYGVPTEAGDFTFTVCMYNSYGTFSKSYKTYTLTVLENTDENVEAATDAGYDLTERIQNIDLNSIGNGSQTMVSQGTYAEFVDVYLDGVKLMEGTDYYSESGSTRITIMNQTLTGNGANSAGTHTLGIEFRTQDTDVLKRASQNYTLTETPTGGNQDNGNNYTDNGGNGSSGTDNGNTGTVSAVNSIATENVSVIEYTIASGDSLWKIARKFYGAGELWRKIYEDNADVIRNPGRIYAGQRIKIYLTQKNDGTEDALKLQEASYTVKPGDNLWKIARSVYGNSIYWRKIYLANKEILSDPGRIYPGQVIIIPES